MSTGQFRYKEYYYEYIDLNEQIRYIHIYGTDRDRDFLARCKETKYLSKHRYQYILRKYTKLKHNVEMYEGLPDYTKITKEELLKMREEMRKDRLLKKRLENNKKIEAEKEIFKKKCKKVDIPKSNILVIDLF